MLNLINMVHGIKQILKSQTTKKSHKNKILVTVNAEL